MDWNMVDAIGTWVSGLGTIMVSYLALKKPSLHLNSIGFVDLGNSDAVNNSIYDTFYNNNKLSKISGNKLGISFNLLNKGNYNIIINSTDIYRSKYKFLPKFIYKINIFNRKFLKKLRINNTNHHFYYDDILKERPPKSINPFSLIYIMVCMDFNQFKIYTNYLDNLVFVIKYNGNEKIYRKLNEEEKEKLNIIIKSFNKCSE